MKTLREILTDRCTDDGCEADDEALEEVLRDCYNEVYRDSGDEHRWRVEYETVKEVEGRFFRVSSFVGKGDCMDAEEAGYSFEGIDNCPEVYPHEVKALIYKTEKPD